MQLVEQDLRPIYNWRTTIQVNCAFFSKIKSPIRKMRQNTNRKELLVADAKNLFEALVREHAGSLTAYLRSVLQSSTDVDDLFQETMIVAWRRLDDFDQSRPFGPWLRGIARNLVHAHGRSLSRRRCTSAMHEQIEVRLSQLSSRPGDTWQEKIDLVHECVEALPDHYRQVVRLRYFHRKAVKQVAQALSVNVNSVKKRLQRARLRLLDCIEMKLEIDECEA